MRRASGVWTLVIAAAVGCAGDDGDGGGTAPPKPFAQVNAPCSELDSMSDGSINFVYQYTYDDAGFLVHYTGEPGAFSGDIEYNDDHFELRSTYNGDADPELEYEAIYTRDDAGRVLTYKERDDSGVRADNVYTYDARGRVMRAVVGRPGTMGLVTSTTDYTYTGDKLNPTTARLVYEGGMSLVTYTSSPDERMLHGDIDDGEDGTVDRTLDVMYDGARRVIASINRTGSAVDTRETASYNARGSLLQQTWANNDTSEPDDYVYTATYGSDSMLSETEVVSPSGDYETSAYTETYKSTCTTPVMTVAPRARRRPTPRDLPPAVVAP